MATTRHCYFFFFFPSCSTSFSLAYSLHLIFFFSNMSNRSRGGGGSGGDGDHRSTPPNIDVMYSLKVDNLTYQYTCRRFTTMFWQIWTHWWYLYSTWSIFSIKSWLCLHSVRHFLLFIPSYIFFLFYFSFQKKHDAEDALWSKWMVPIIDGREIRVQFARYGRASTTDSRDKTSRPSSVRI